MTSTSREQVSSTMDDLLKSFPTYTLADLKAFKLDPRNHIMGEGILRKGGSCLLTGTITGMGKSIMAEQIAICIAAGVPCFGMKVRGPRKVLMIQAENDEEFLQRSVVNITEQVKAKSALVQKNLIIKHVPGLSEGQFGDFLHACVKIHKPDLVVIDPYQSYVGSVDMNTTTSFLSWKGPVEYVLQHYNCALLLVAHGPRPRDKVDWSPREGIYQQMGTSTLSNWVRSGFELLPVKGDLKRFRLHFSKNAELNGLESHGEVIRELFLEHSGDFKKPYWKLSEKQASAKKVDTGEMVRLVKKKHPDWSQAAIAKHLHLGKTTVKYHLSKKLEGALKETNGKKK